MHVELGSRADAALLARRAIGDLAATLPAQTLQELKLLVTEMVTNSVKHADGEGPIGLELRVGTGAVLIAVTDSGHGFEPLAPDPDPDAEAGRGLFIIDALADRWGVDRAHGTRVWAELDVVPAATEPAATRPRAQLPRRS
jgi:anti-sigma regulatory factor (Ser/Thr protein kinase)